MKIELDLCWITAAGKDPLDYFHKYPGRFPLVHVKGLHKVPAPSTDPTPIAQVVDWKRIVAASKQAGIQHYFVEHDVPKDAFASLKASYEYVSQLHFLKTRAGVRPITMRT